ncbi:MAG: thioredoxin [Bacteroidales bacterium]|nr:thioredoxin [Bacteroidales bacterium]
MNRILILTVLSLALMLSSCSSSGQNNKVKHLDTKTFKEKVFNYDLNSDWKFAGNKPAIVDFYASWCGPCKRMSPVMEELANEYDGKVNVYKVNVDAEQSLAQYFGIQSIPTFLLIPINGKPRIIQGVVAYEAFKNTINENLLNN